MTKERERLLLEGLVAGMLGYAAVAVFCAGMNLALGRSPFYTAALLGEMLFYGLEDPALLSLDPGPILAYNGVHLFAFLAIGMIAALLVLETERHPRQFWFVFVVILGLLILSYAMVVLLAAPLAEALPWWAIGGANLTAVAAMGSYLWWVHPRLRQELRELDQMEDAESMPL